MALSVFDLFKIGIGPSSSHTVGPMRAAALFVRALEKNQQLASVTRVETRLYGSLGATGKGHGTDTAVMLGLQGLMPDLIDPDTIAPRLEEIRKTQQLPLAGKHLIRFSEKSDIGFYRRETLKFHTNGLTLVAYDDKNSVILEKNYFSVGGGFVVNQDDAQAALEGKKVVADPTVIPYPYSSGDELLALTQAHGMTIAQLVFQNELA